MSSHLPLLVVVGATGQQGSSVIEHILPLNKFRIRGLTRKIDSPSARKLAMQGVEIVSCDFNIRSQVKQAFQGAYAVFAVTQFWEQQNAALETKQGILMADVAKECGVKHYIWSGLNNVHEQTKGRFMCEPFTSKAKVTEHIRSIGLPATVVQMCFYFENFAEFNLAKDDGTTVAFAIPALKADTKVAMGTVRDYGAYVAMALQNREDYLGQEVPVLAAQYSMEDICHIVTAVTGKKATFATVAADTKQAGGDTFAETCQYFNEFGYFGKSGFDLDGAAKKNRNVLFEEYLRTTGVYSKN